MHRAVWLIIGLAVVGGGPVAAVRADDAPPGLDDRRFSFHKVEGGFLRLDLHTGALSLCAPHPAGWVCTVTPDERTALENEIARLQRENASAKRAMLERGLPLPDGMSPDAVPTRPPATPKSSPPVPQTPRSTQPGRRLPTQADIDHVMDIVEQFWRRMVDMIASLQRDILKKT